MDYSESWPAEASILQSALSVAYTGDPLVWLRQRWCFCTNRSNRCTQYHQSEAACVVWSHSAAPSWHSSSQGPPHGSPNAASKFSAWHHLATSSGQTPFDVATTTHRWHRHLREPAVGLSSLSLEVGRTTYSWFQRLIDYYNNEQTSRASIGCNVAQWTTGRMRCNLRPRWLSTATARKWDENESRWRQMSLMRRQSFPAVSHFDPCVLTYLRSYVLGRLAVNITQSYFVRISSQTFRLFLRFLTLIFLVDLAVICHLGHSR